MTLILRKATLEPSDRLSYIAIHIFMSYTLWGDEVSMLTHTYPYKPPRKIKVTICNHQADNQLYVWSDV